MEMSPRKIPVVFYRTSSGSEVVRDWIKELPEVDRVIIGQDLMRVQFRWPIGMPLCRAMGDGLWEVRSKLSGTRIARLFFCFTQERLIVLHGIIKTSQKTPFADLELARKRMREFE